LLIEKILITIGFIIIIYSTIHLQIAQSKGLVISGPYRILRHPQYLGMIIATIGLTSWSIWWLRNTFGIGFLNPSQTIALWSIELFAYIILAIIEEQHLIGIFNGSYEEYSAQVPFFIPFFSVKGRIQEVISSILIPVVILFGLLWMHAPMH
jgi:protein-S-isoprenylcysteine O-methyltransferase Ste14